MSELSYNDIDLKIVHTHSYNEESTTDDRGNYVFTRTKVFWTVWWNPKATSAKLQGVAGAQTVVQADGNNAPVTELALRHALSQPRKKLVWEVGPTTIIETPAADMESDPTNGPFPVAKNIVWVVAEKTFQISFGVEFTYRDAAKFTESPPILMSHTWEESRGVDAGLYTVRTIRGKAVFDAGMLKKEGLVPDDFSKHLIVPPPHKYKRHHVEVTAAENGYEIYYIVLDRHARLAYKEAGIVDLRGTVSGGITIPGVLDVAMNLGQTIGAAVGTSGGSLITSAPQMISSLPKRYRKVVIQVMGGPDTPYSIIRRCAYDCLRYQIAQIVPNGGLMANAPVGGEGGGMNPWVNGAGWISFGMAWPVVTAGIDTVGNAANNGFANAVPPGVTWQVALDETRQLDTGGLQLTATFSSGIGDAAVTFISDNGVVIDGALLPDNNGNEIHPNYASFEYAPPTPGASMPFHNGVREFMLVRAVSQALQAENEAPLKPGVVGDPRNSGTGNRTVTVATNDPHSNL